jgi:hypothetical protein
MVFELSPSNGNLLRSYSVGQMVPLPAIVKDSVLFVVSATGQAFYSMNAVDLKTKQTKWVRGLGYNPPLGLSLAGNNIVFRNEFAKLLTAINTTSGAIEWTREPTYRNHFTYGNNIYAVEEKGSSYFGLDAINAQNGQKFWTWTKPNLYSIGQVYPYKDQVNFIVSGATASLAYVSVKASNGDSLWRKNDVFTRSIWKSELAGDYYYSYENRWGIPGGKIFIYDAKTFSLKDSSISIALTSPHFMVIKKSQN